MNSQQPSRINQIFDLLAAEIEERMQARRPPQPPAETPAVLVPLPPAAPVRPLEALPWLPEAAAGQPPAPYREAGPAPELPPEPQPARGEEPQPVFLGPPHAARLMVRLALALLVAVVVINVPLNRHGTTLATALPESAALVVRDGLVVKEKSDEKIYVYQRDKFRWISSLDAFEHYGFTWGDVHVVEDGYLDRFEIGTPIHVLLKCQQSPHIYRLEGGARRWIRDIATFEAEGHVWEDVRFVSCGYLRSLPDGETIPPGSGPPPQP